MSKEKKSKMAAAPQARLRLPDFHHHVDHAAIVDKVNLSVDATLNPSSLNNELSNVVNKSIFRPGKLYAACIFAKWRLTRNPVMIRHGKMTKFPNVPELHLTLRSERTPLTAAQLQLLIRSCVRGNKKALVTVSYVEMAFDFTGTSIDRVREQLIHRALRVHSMEDRKGRKTIYVGSPKSSWQVRIYDKDKEKKSGPV